MINLKSINFTVIMVLSILFVSKAQTGYLKVVSEPAGVIIKVDGILYGITNPNLIIELPVGTHMIQAIKENYKNVEKSISISADIVFTLRISLSAVEERIESLKENEDILMKSEVGNIVVTSNPPELPVYLNGEYKGETPLKISNSRTGNIRIDIGSVVSKFVLLKGETIRVKLDGNKILYEGGSASNSCNGLSSVYYEGKTYNTIQVGSQCWLKENLDVGYMINSRQNANNNKIIEKFCYGDNLSNCAKYGGLYQWDEAMQYLRIKGAKGICPNGWHIPTKEEFEMLKFFVDDNSNSLKSTGQGIDWGLGTNQSGFSALLAGYQETGGNFENQSSTADFLTSSESDLGSFWVMTVSNNSRDILLLKYFKLGAFSVRCLKN